MIIYDNNIKLTIKDLNALICTMEKNDINPLVLKAVWEENKVVRNEWDWALSPSAVRKKDE